MASVDAQDATVRPKDTWLDVLIPLRLGSGRDESEKYRSQQSQPTSSYDMLRDYSPLRFHEPQICNSAGNGSVADAVWATFQQFVSDGIPLKIVGLDSMQDGTFGCSSDDTMMSGSIPDAALSSTITVQCKPKSNAEDKRPSESDTKRKRLMKDIDKALSVATGRDMGDESNLFLGQEDQLTTKMELGDVLSGNYSTSRMQICVAQETIMSSPDSDASSSIDVQSDGSIRRIGRGIDNESEPLSALASWVRAPAYLLPKGKVHVREINLWYAPEVTRTNTHYDGNHNVLVVLRGTKTLELTPPGAIRGSPLHSEHANHPAVLRSTELGGNCDLWPSLSSELEKTEKRCAESTLVGSVSAGEAIFIPEGWWHRVESSADCLAVNFWFDHSATSTSALARPSNKHMLPYQAREMARLYVDANFDRVADALLKEALEDIPRSLLPTKLQKDMSTDSESENRSKKSLLGCDTLECREDRKDVDWNAVRRRGYTKDEIRICFENITREADELQRYTDDESDPRRDECCTSTSQIDTLGCFLSIFLAHIRPDRESDRRAAIHVLGNIFPKFCMHWGERSVANHKRMFLEVVLRLQAVACWQMSQVWERHKPASEAEASYNAFFASCWDDGGRRHVLAQVEGFKLDVTARLLFGDLMLINSEFNGRG